MLGPLGAPAGLQVTWTLRLRRDQENIDHQRRLQAIDHSATEQIRAAERGMEIDVEVDRRNRQQDHLQIGRATEYGRQQQELVLQQQRWQHDQAMLASGQQHELALRQGEQMLELQRIEAQKIEFFQWHLSQGGVQAWAMHLAQHPEDSRLVMTSMREDQLRMIQAQMDLVGQLLSGDTAESYELEGPKQLALRTVSDILNQRLPGVPQTPPLIAPQGDGPGYPDTPDHQGPGGRAPAQTTPGTQAPGPGTYAPQPPAPPGPQEPQAPPTQHPAAAAPGTPLPDRTSWGPSTPYAPPPTPYAPPLTLPGSHPGAPAPPSAPERTPAWQPPPGYGSTPTQPAQAPPPEPGHPSDQAPQPHADDPNNSQEASST